MVGQPQPISKGNLEVTFDVVLQWGTSNQQAKTGREALERIVELRVAILQAMGLVDLQSLPLDLLKVLTILENELVGGEQHLMLLVLELCNLQKRSHIELEILERPKLGLANHFSRGR